MVLRAGSNGRFVIQIPFKRPIKMLEEPQSKAKKRFYSLERKIQNNYIIKESYISFMNEYIPMGHMSKVESSNSPINYYLPHHGVYKE